MRRSDGANALPHVLREGKSAVHQSNTNKRGEEKETPVWICGKGVGQKVKGPGRVSSELAYPRPSSPPSAPTKEGLVAHRGGQARHLWANTLQSYRCPVRSRQTSFGDNTHATAPHVKPCGAAEQKSRSERK
eukprot:6138975-Prymnesium_polylepis.2